jgi:hypothetical protein
MEEQIQQDVPAQEQQAEDLSTQQSEQQAEGETHDQAQESN